MQNHLMMKKKMVKNLVLKNYIALSCLCIAPFLILGISAIILVDNLPILLIQFTIGFILSIIMIIFFNRHFILYHDILEYLKKLNDESDEIFTNIVLDNYLSFL